MKAFVSLLGLVALCLTAAVVLFGCAAPEPQIVTKTVNVAVPTPCSPNTGPRPDLMTKDQLKAAMAAAPNFDEQVKIAAAQLLLYVGWVPVLENALAGCKGVQTDQK